jgi:histone acetyltransferase (RNA polymerase elongator complex component)
MATKKRSSQHSYTVSIVQLGGTFPGAEVSTKAKAVELAKKLMKNDDNAIQISQYDQVVAWREYGSKKLKMV